MTVSAFRCMHARSGKELRVQSEKIWVQSVEADGQSLRPRNRCRQICGVLECGTRNEHEWADINNTEDIARREEHTAPRGQEDCRGCDNSGGEINHAL